MSRSWKMVEVKRKRFAFCFQWHGKTCQDFMQRIKIICISIKKTIWLVSGIRGGKSTVITRKSKKYHWSWQYGNHCDLDKGHYSGLVARELPAGAGWGETTWWGSGICEAPPKQHVLKQHVFKVRRNFKDNLAQPFHLTDDWHKI